MKNELEQAREAAIAHFGCGEANFDERCVPEHGAYIDGYRTGVEAAQPQWVRVSDRLPTKADVILVTHAWPHTYDITVDVARYVEGEWKWDDDSPVSDAYPIIAWMPLPEPYTADEEAARL